MRVCCLLLFFSLSFLKAQNLDSFSKDTILMGSAFSITAVHEDQILAEQAVFAGIVEINRIEDLISSWKSDSQTSEINKNAGVKAIKVDKELFNLIVRSLKFSELSNGYFDISFASINKLWDFNGKEQLLPSEQLIQESVAQIDYRNIILDFKNQTVFLKNPGMKIGFGAIGKGYAADRAKTIMAAMGIENGVVNAAGDILTWGNKPNGESWNFGIANPNEKNAVLSSLKLKNQAVVTSGSYEKYLIIDGIRYGHIINPKTGMPAKGLLSVTIIAETAEMADAMATTVFILGETEGLQLINHLKGVEAIIINDQNISLYSNGISINQLNEPKN